MHKLLCSLAAFTLLALSGCSKNQPPPVAPSALPSWEQLSLPASDKNFYAIYSFGAEVYSGNLSGTLYVSTDEGSTWKARSSAGAAPLTIKKLGPYLCYCPGAGGIGRSTDDGSTWLPQPNATPPGAVSDLIISDSVVLASIQSMYTPACIYRSSDSASHWRRSGTGLDSAMSVSGLRRVGGTLFAGEMGGGVFTSVDDGATWLAPPGSIRSYTIQALETSGSSVIAGTYNHGILVSRDGGATWAYVYGGISPTADITCLTANGTSVFAPAGSSIFVTADAGNSWTDITRGASIGQIHALAADASYLFATSNSGVWRLHL